MKNQPKLSKNIKFIISIFVIFIVFPNTIIAQQSYQDIVNQVDEIDNEIKRLTLLRESIGLEFKEISNFSKKARPLILKYDNINDEILKYKRRLEGYSMYSQEEIKNNEIVNYYIKKYEENIVNLTAEQNELMGNKGVVSFFDVNCKTIEDLQREYNRVTNYYLKKKTQYDDIAVELGKLNTDKHNLVTKLKDIEDDEGVIPLDLTGCWKLQFGNHISEITVSKHESGKYVGTLTVNNLENYYDGQRVFIVSRVSYNTFSGWEYTWEEKPNSTVVEEAIHAVITINTDNNYLTWTSDQTVTMSRCH